MMAWPADETKRKSLVLLFEKTSINLVFNYSFITYMLRGTFHALVFCFRGSLALTPPDSSFYQFAHLFSKGKPKYH